MTTLCIERQLSWFTLEYSCASLLYFVCRSVTLAIVAGIVIPWIIFDAGKRYCPSNSCPIILTTLLFTILNARAVTLLTKVD